MPNLPEDDMTLSYNTDYSAPAKSAKLKYFYHLKYHL